MPPQTLEARVERLEERVTKLEDLPARMDALSTQISQLREEMHSGFSNLREELRTEIRAGDEETPPMCSRAEMSEHLHRGSMRLPTSIMGQARMLYEDMSAKLRVVAEEG